MFYIKSQAIEKQVPNAKFTMKAFKMLNSKLLNKKAEKQDEIISTVGGIIIDEDDKCAKELCNVLTKKDVSILIYAK